MTSAHEFHHASQFAYDWAEDAWLMEGTAANIEETVYPAIDDNVFFLHLWSPLTRPSSPLDRGGFGDSEYGSWIFWRYLQEKIGGDPSIVREIWERADAFDPSAAPGDDPPDDYSLEAVQPRAHRARPRLRRTCSRTSPPRTACWTTPTPSMRTTLLPALTNTVSDRPEQASHQLAILADQPSGDALLLLQAQSSKWVRRKLRVTDPTAEVRSYRHLIVVDANGSTSTRRLDATACGYASGATRFGAERDQAHRGRPLERKQPHVLVLDLPGAAGVLLRRPPARRRRSLPAPRAYLPLGGLARAARRPRSAGGTAAFGARAGP